MSPAAAARVSARVTRVRVPFRVPLVTAAGTWRSRDSWLMCVTAPDGRTGWGEAVAEAPEAAAVLEALLDDLATTGLPPSQPLLERADAGGRAFRAAWDGARLDIHRQGRPADAVAPPSVAVNAVIGALAPDQAAAAAAGAVTAGFGTLKLKAAPRESAADLVARVGAVRAVVGDGVALRLDANGTWDIETAERRLRMLAGFGLQYVEQPLGPGDLAGAARLRQRVATPIAADEAAWSLASARAILEARAADVLVVKPARVGGPEAVGEIALLAAEHGVPVVVSTLFETGVGLAGALACASAVPAVPGWPAEERAHGLATSTLLEDDLVRARFVVARGRIAAPRGPGSGGLGIAVDEAAVRRYAVREP
jgi:L-alanine-DL-glutamate epimerase-like enolase superfamily enzyme